MSESMEASSGSRLAILCILVAWAIVIASFTVPGVDAIHSASVDFAHHAALVARLLYDGHVVAGDPSLGEMASYPRGSHLLAAWAGHLSGSAIVGMQWVSVASYALAWTALAASLLLLEGRMRTTAIAIWILLLVSNRWIGVEWFGDEILRPYHFSQLVAQSLALAALVAASAMERRGVARWATGIGLIAAACALVDVHLLPALELLGAKAFLDAHDLVRAKTDRLKPALFAGAMLATASAYIVTHPAFSAMRSIAAHNGAIELRFIHDLPEMAILALIAGALSIAVMLVSEGLRLAHRRDGAAALFRHMGAFGTSAAVLCLVQMAALVIGGVGSPYAVYKYAFALQGFIAVSVVLLIVARCGGNGTFAPLHALIALVIPCVALSSLNRAPHSSTSVMAVAERETRELAPLIPSIGDGRWTYVHGISSIAAVGNYYLTIAMFHTPRDANTLDILAGDPPSDPASVGYIVTSLDTTADIGTCQRAAVGGVVAIDQVCAREAGPIACRGQWVLSSTRFGSIELQGFSQAEADGRWTSGKEATLRCKRPSPESPMRIAMQVSSLVASGRPQNLKVRIDGGQEASWTFDEATPARLIELFAPSSASDMLTLTFTTPDAISPFAVGLGADDRILGIKLHTIDFSTR